MWVTNPYTLVLYRIQFIEKANIHDDMNTTLNAFLFVIGQKLNFEIIQNNVRKYYAILNNFLNIKFFYFCMTTIFIL